MGRLSKKEIFDKHSSKEGMKMGRKIIVAILSTIIASFILGIVFYGSGLSIPESIWANALFFTMYTAPAYFLGGIPISILLDKFMKGKLILFLVYVISGFVVGILMFLVLGLLNHTSLNQYDFEPALTFGLCGALSALLFYLVMLLIDLLKTWERPN